VSLGNVWVVAGIVLLLNVPFGFWRAGTRKFGVAWFVAVHAPVPFVAGLRMWAGLPWRVATVLPLAAAFFAGQLLGSRLRDRGGEVGSDAA